MDDATVETEDEILALEDKDRLIFIQDWFERAGDRLLHLSVSDEIIFANLDSCITNYILTLLPRVEALDLLLCRRTLPRFTELQLNGYQHLRKLRIVGDGFDPEDWSFLLYDAPNLTEFDLRFVYYPVDSFPLKWDSLTRLAVSFFPNPADCPSTNALLDLLQRTPRLQSLRMVVGSSDSTLNGNHKPIQLPHLHTLQLRFQDSSIEDIIPLLQVPSLASVELNGPGREGSLQALLTLLKHLSKGERKTKVTYLVVHLDPTQDTVDRIVNCFEYVPNLRHLTLHYPRQLPEITTSNALEVLAKTNVCPNVQVLEVCDRANLGKLEHVLGVLRMKKTRGDSCSPLLKVTIQRSWVSWDKSGEDVSELESLTQGAEVVLFDHWAEEPTNKRGFWEEQWYDA